MAAFPVKVNVTPEAHPGIIGKFRWLTRVGVPLAANKNSIRREKYFLYRAFLCVGALGQQLYRAVGAKR